MLVISFSVRLIIVLVDIPMQVVFNTKKMSGGADRDLDGGSGVFGDADTVAEK